MRNVILQKDYEKYELILPYNILFGRAKHRFIYSELEKMHPCFSNEFCVDSVFKGLSKKGIRSDVVVMHKFKLAEYEGRRSFSGLGFALSGDRAGRRFVSRKIKAAVSLFFLLLIITSFLLLKKERLYVEEERNESAENPVLMSPLPLHFIGGDFFKLVIENGGYVNSLRWSSDFFTETIEAEVEGVFPETLSQTFPDAILSSVKYKEEKPNLHFKSLQKLNFSSTETALQLHGNYFELQSSLRKLLEENSAELKEENLKPYRIQFEAPREKFIGLISALYDLFSAYDFLITEITYSILSSQKLNISISAEEKFAYAAGIPLNELSENLLPKRQSKKVNMSLPKSVPAGKNISLLDSSENYGLKVGEITRDEIIEAGRIKTIRTVFYKTPEGKMLKKEEVVN